MAQLAQGQRRIELLPDSESIKMEVINVKCSSITTNDFKLNVNRGADFLKVEVANSGQRLITVKTIVIRRSLQGKRFEHGSGFATLKPLNSPNSKWRGHRSTTTYSLDWTTAGDAGKVYDHKSGEYKIILMPMFADERWEEGDARKDLTACGAQAVAIARTISAAIEGGKDFVTIEE